MIHDGAADVVQRAVEHELATTVRELHPRSGGDVATSFAVDTTDRGRVFAKTHPAPPRGFFTTEARGLAWLHDTETVAVPAVLAASDDPPVLVLEWVEEGPLEDGPRRERSDAELGRALAGLHSAGMASFGRPDRRSTGSRGLPNEPCATWVEFYATQRLAPLVRLAGDAGALPSHTLAGLEAVAARLDRLGGPPEPPALLHGDLWAGNRLIDTQGSSWLIDPAAHGGHREFDLAMMRLFGGFGPECFAAYDEVAPLAAGWEERVPLHQLAPLVVHAIKFGGGYVGAVEDALRRLR